MKGFIKLNFDAKKEDYELLSARGYYDCDYILDVNLKSKIEYKDIVENKKKIYKYLKQYYEYQCQFNGKFIEDRKLYQRYFSNQLELFEDVIYIELNGSFKEVHDYLKLNPILKSKNILLGDSLDLDYGTLLEVKKYLGDFNNIYFKVDGNDDLVKIDAYEKTVDKIYEIVNQIRMYDYSPLEYIMHAYDLVRDREYKKENIGEKYTVSRDLTSVLLGDKIVCSGYANIFQKILTKFNVHSIIHRLSGKNGMDGHAIVLAYVKDDKYNIEGVYDFDITADGKKDNNNFFNIYRGFAKTRTQIMHMYQGKFNDETFPALHNNLIDDFESFYNDDEFDNMSSEMFKTINRLSNLIDGKTILNVLQLIDKQKIDINQITDDLYRYDDFLSNVIEADVFLKLLYNVRKNEYYENPNKYPFNISAFREALLKSGFIFKDNAEMNILQKMFNISLISSKDVLEAKTDDCINEFELEKKITGVILSKTLKLVYEKKKNI